ncbi:hypothetical protein JTB14_037191 [Gonioctena quinquepunctata]|nr:hypothetical protein JTB14_037191 [Gonioctena quinquepunctata]
MSEEFWPTEDKDEGSIGELEKEHFNLIEEKEDSLPDVNRFFRLLKLVRSTAYMLGFQSEKKCSQTERRVNSRRDI